MNLGMYPTIAVPQQQGFFSPGGRLTLVQGSPVISSDQTSKGTVFYTPAVHGAIPFIRNGVISPVYFNDDLVLTLTSDFTANGIFDVFAVDSVLGGAQLVAGNAWTTPSAGAGSRGTGGGTTELTRVAGLLCNMWPMAGMNAEGATFIPAMGGIYLGSILIDGSAGLVTCHVSYGQSRRWGVWNAYNRELICLRAGDPTSAWLGGVTSDFHPSNNNAANTVTLFSGIALDNAEISFQQVVNISTTSSSLSSMAIGIGLNSTSVSFGTASFTTLNNSGSSNSSIPLLASAVCPPREGINVISALERTSSTNGNCSFIGQQPSMLLTAKWKG